MERRPMERKETQAKGQKRTAQVLTAKAFYHEGHEVHKGECEKGNHNERNGRNGGEAKCVINRNDMHLAAAPRHALRALCG